MRKQSLIYLVDLTVILTQKELKAKYKSTTLGFLWVLLNPILQMIVLTIVFSLFIKIHIHNYPLFVFSGLLPWTFFTLSIQSGTSSLITNRDIIKKVKFPYELLPISSVFANLLTFCLALILLIISAWFINGFSPTIVFLVPVVLLETILAVSISLLLSSLDIYYRDVSFLLQSVVLIWFYLTPIFYPITLIPQKYALVYSLNPVVGIITAYQSILLQNNFLLANSLLISIVETSILFIMSIIIFRRRAKLFVDWV